MPRDRDRISKRIAEVVSSRTDNPAQKVKEKQLVEDIEENIKLVKDTIGMSDDVVFRRFHLGSSLKIEATLVFIDGMTDMQIINKSILQPLMTEKFSTDGVRDISLADIMSFIKEYVMTVNELEMVDNLDKAISAPLNGDTVLLIDGFNQAIILNSKGWEKRGVQEPTAESVVRGPREGFTENYRTNTSLIRRIIRHPALRIKNYKVGKVTNTNVGVCYIEGLANKYLVEEVIERINNIEIDQVLDSGYIEQLIEDDHISPFAQTMATERPDRVAGNLTEGRVAIIVDGSPFVLVVPITFTILLQSPEDYYERFIVSSLLRIIRAIAIFIAATFPGLYIALVSFHPEMLPTRLILSWAGGRALVPFPSYIEAFIMVGVMELLREASLRLPGMIGPTIGIVGALIVGEAAVSAGIVSPFMVIVIATTTIASFAIPDYSSAISLRLIKFPIMIGATFFGLYGLILVLIVISIHLAGLKSFGIPYLTPMAPSRLSDLKDTFFRAPLWLLFKRPIMLRPGNIQRFSSKGDDDRNERTR